MRGNCPTHFHPNTSARLVAGSGLVLVLDAFADNPRLYEFAYNFSLCAIAYIDILYELAYIARGGHR